MSQPLLPLSPPPEPIIGPRPGAVSHIERQRLSRQCRAIIARLEQGSATNDELATIARKYTGRLSEIRQAGYDVRMIEQNHRTGLTRYELKGRR